MAGMLARQECQKARNASKAGMPARQECQPGRNASQAGIPARQECQQGRNASKVGMSAEAMTSTKEDVPSISGQVIHIGQGCFDGFTLTDPNGRECPGWHPTPHPERLSYRCLLINGMYFMGWAMGHL
jgi:hypothetical protein